jgi:hypothetical protein
MGNGGIKYKFTGGDPNAPGGTTWEPITTAQEVGRWRGAQP